MTRRILLNGVPILVAVLAVLLWPPRRATAFNPQPDPPAFGLVGIGPNEMLRMNAVCADTPLPGDMPPGSCEVTLVVRDMSGRALKSASMTLAPGQGTSLDFGNAENGVGRRMELQPFYAPVGRGFILATVEVVDMSGRTAAVLNPTEPKSLAVGSAGR